MLPTRPVRRRRSRGAAPGPDSGAAAVEFALVSLLLFTLLFGILQYGIFFFQSIRAEHTAGEAAVLVQRAVAEVDPGTPRACVEWRRLFEPTAGGAGVMTGRSSWLPVDDSTDVAVGDAVVVSVRWEPIEVAGGLVPVPGAGERTTSVQTTVTHLGEGAEYTLPGLGCPDPGPGS